MALLLCNVIHYYALLCPVMPCYALLCTVMHNHAQHKQLYVLIISMLARIRNTTEVTGYNNTVTVAFRSNRAPP